MRLLADQKYKEPKPCENCGGRHYGSPSGYCPYIKAACVVCGDQTIYACSDCAINSGGKRSVHVCPKSECQSTHEHTVHHAIPRKLQDLSPEKASEGK